MGWFSFSCCEDSTIIFTEILNDHYLEWKKIIDFKAILPLQRREDLSELDVAFVEGAITSLEQEERLKKIRMATKKLIAVGACAVVGMPGGQRNLFPEKTKQEIGAFLLQFKYAERVRKLSDIITVDDVVPGCPMDEKKFLDIMNKYLIEFQIIEENIR